MKLKILFVFIGVIMLQRSVSAQPTILPDISPAYLDKLIETAKLNYPAVKANQHKVEEAKANVSKANISYLDVFSVSYIYQPNGFSGINTNGSTNTTGTNGTSYNYFQGIQAGVTFNLGSFFEKPAEIKAAKQELAIAQDSQDEYMLTLTNNVKKRYYVYVQGIANLKLLTQSSNDAQEVFVSEKHRFEKGEVTFEEYNRAQLSLTTSYQEKILAESNLLIAKSDLEELLGEKLEDVK
jgi:outer membrane protein TolC